MKQLIECVPNFSGLHNKATAILVCILISVFFLGCKSIPKEIQPGSICSIESGDGTFGVVKVLVINDEEAHIKIYANKFAERPTEIDVKTLVMGSILDGGDFGIGHVPLERKGFDNWKPIEIAFEAVTEDDLVGYKMWRDQ
jgi:hypothetical protein